MSTRTMVPIISAKYFFISMIFMKLSVRDGTASVCNNHILTTDLK